MENISKFLDAIKLYGVPEISCFQTVDLYERKQFYKVIIAVITAVSDDDFIINFPRFLNVSGLWLHL